MLIEVTHNNTPAAVNIVQGLSGILNEVADAKGGQFAFIRKHETGMDSKKCTLTDISDKSFMQKPVYANHVQRMIERVEVVTLVETVEAMTDAQFDKVDAKAKADGITIDDFFADSKETVLSRLRKEDPTTSGQRLGQAVNYVYYKGWKLHLVTVKGKDKLTRPVLDDDGLMTVKSIMLPFYEINRSHDGKGLRKGKYLPTNSKGDTILREAIKRATGEKPWKTLSLAKRNYESICMDHKMIGLDEHTSKLVADLSEAKDEAQAES